MNQLVRRDSCKHVTTEGAEAICQVKLQLLDSAPPTAVARREWIEIEMKFCALCTATVRYFFDSTTMIIPGD